MNRGARREPIFRDALHCHIFFEHLAKVVTRFGLEVHAYVLMPNHFHLLVRSVRGNLSECMKHLLGPYTQQLNKRYDWDGPVFRGRFRNQVVSESQHLAVLIPYIHLNPVRGGLVRSPDDALWTSYNNYIGSSLTPEWLTTSTVLSLYKSVDNLVAETMGYQTGELSWPSDFDLERGIFRAWSPDVPVTAEQKKVWKDEQVRIIRQVHWEVTALPWSEVAISTRGRGSNPARRLAVWLLATRTDLTYREIAKVVGGGANQVSLTLHILRKEKFDEPLKRWMERADLWLTENELANLAAASVRAERKQI